MFIGHYALGLASRKIDKAPSLAIMFVAVQFLDLLWPILVLLKIETVQIDAGTTALNPLNFTFYPYSHSCLTSLLWALLFGLGYYLITKNRKGSLLLFGLVFSHWILDFLTHRPDLPLSPFSDIKVGLGLWNFPVTESILEIGMFALGIILYTKSSKPKRPMAFWTLVAFLFVIHVLNVFGPPPPKAETVAWAANLMWLFVLWAWWSEKQKNPSVNRNS